MTTFITIQDGNVVLNAQHIASLNLDERYSGNGYFYSLLVKTTDGCWYTDKNFRTRAEALAAMQEIQEKLSQA